jgi:glycosyltransferase involved in cell wall biosynthesis
VTSLVAAAVGPLAIPHASWDDATNAAMEQYYPDFRRMAGASRRDSAVMGRRAVDAVDLAIYASDWAAHSARTAYGVDEGRIAVVPFGANLEVIPAGEDVERFIADRGDTICRLLWVGVDWRRKGGPLTVEIARALRDLGVDVELTVVGCEPEERAAFPDWVHVEGFISKRDEAGRMRLAALFARSHFFIMPSNAEAFGLVYAEASAFGVPSVAIRTGGVPTIIVDGETGLLFDAGTSAVACATRMLSLFQDRSGYVSAARAARRRFSARLNWDVAGSEVLARLGHLAR